MQRFIFGMALVVVLAGAAVSDAATIFEESFTVLDSIGQNPFSVHDAVIKVEGNGTSFWMPTTANVWGEVIYKFDIPFAIETANIDTKIHSYNGHDLLPNFDPGGTAYLDISTDFTNWDTIVSITPELLSDANLDQYDISSLVYGSNVVYIRARLFSTVAPFQATQFMRVAPDGIYNPPHSSRLALRATAVPEPSTIIMLLTGALGLLAYNIKRRKR